MSKKFDWGKFAENRFNHLLIILISLFVISPFFQVEGTMAFRPILPFIYLIAVLGIIRSIVKENKKFYILAALKILSFILDMMAHFHVMSSVDYALHIVARVVQIFLMFFVVDHLIRWLFSVKKVNADTVKGGICIYFLIGLTWMALYRLLYVLDPASFSIQFYNAWELIHFSFTTLTTLGYGDITPVSSSAKMLTNLEAIVGQMFLVIFMARLIGLHITHSHNEG